jgi:hypothetical protein
MPAMSILSWRLREAFLIALAIASGCGRTKSSASPADGGGGGGAAGSVVGQDASDATAAGSGGGGAGGAAGGGGADAGPQADAAGDVTSAAGNAGALACPATPPLEGASCGGQNCVYEDCAGAGRIVASCYPEGSFQLSYGACSSVTCPGASASPCPMGSLCLKKPVGGVLTATCLANPCGRGPITCDCATCSGACSVAGTVDGVTVICQTP